MVVCHCRVYRRSRNYAPHSTVLRAHRVATLGFPLPLNVVFQINSNNIMVLLLAGRGRRTGSRFTQYYYTAHVGNTEFCRSSRSPTGQLVHLSSNIDSELSLQVSYIKAIDVWYALSFFLSFCGCAD
jgi:hypothetical protein